MPAGDGVWRVWRVLEGLERLERLENFGGFAGWQTAALKAHRKPLLWPWPWGACWGSGLGPGPGPWPWGACWGSCLGLRMHVGEGVWNFGSLDPLQL